MNPRSRQIILVLGDIFLLYLTLLIIVFLRFGDIFNKEIFLEHLFPFSIIYFFWLIIFYIFGLYDLRSIKNKISFYSRFLGAISVGLALGMIFFYLVPFFVITPKTNLILNVLIFAILFFFWRNLFYSFFSNYFLSNVAIFGQGAEVENLKKEISQKPYLGYKLIPIDLKKDFLTQIKKETIDTVIFTEEYEHNPKFLTALYMYLSAKMNFLDFASAYELITEKIPVANIAKNWFLENLREGDKGLYDKVKRIFDIILAGFLLILTSPFWPLIALAIKLEDRGPVFYKQKRVGKDRKNFLLIKFRSMIIEAEKKGPQWAEKKDERTTNFGKFLRRIHLDEIPQMINVLTGDISLVGPRPERPEFVEELEKQIPHYHIRHLIKPGFTGWAQIKFRYSRSIMDSFEKFQYDLYYLKNRSLMLDLQILLKTFQLFFKKE